MSESRRRYLHALLSTAFTAALVYWFVLSVDLRAAIDLLESLDTSVVAAAVAVYVASILLNGLRWWILLRHVAGSVRFAHAMSGYYMGTFLNGILPSSMGGDIARTLYLGLRGMDWKALTASAIVDRAAGLLVTLLLCSIAAPFIADLPLGRSDRIGIWATTGCAALLFSALVSPAFRQPLERLALRYDRTRIRSFLIETARVCQSYRVTNAALAAAGILTLLAQSLVILVHYYLGQSLGIAVPLLAYFVIVPIVFLAASLPVSIGGLGVREGALLALLTAAGTEMPAAAALSLALLLVSWAASLPGAAMFLLRQRRLAGRSMPGGQPHLRSALRQGRR